MRKLTVTMQCFLRQDVEIEVDDDASSDEIEYIAAKKVEDDAEWALSPLDWTVLRIHDPKDRVDETT